MLVNSRLLVATLVVTLLVTGCTSDDGLNRNANITGLVTLDGEPLAGGIVVFESANGLFNPQAAIRLDGTYVIQEPPLGKCRLAVKTAHMKSFAPPIQMRGKVTKKQYPGYVEDDIGYFTAIPKHYESLDTSGFEIDVQKGNAVFDLEMVSK